MSRLIDADARIEEIKKANCTGCDNYHGIKCRACWVDDAISLIDDAPAVDAVEVVRCKDCKHCIYISYACGDVRCGKLHTDYIKENSFCSYGERKDNEEH